MSWEDAIASQIFQMQTMEVKVVEHFRLTSSYNLQNFYKVYRPSILLELKEVSPLLHQTFCMYKCVFQTKIPFMPPFPTALFRKGARMN